MDADELKKYGRFTFIEKLKMGGTGSEKIIYLTGIAAFDEWISFNQDGNYCSFEIYPNGIICRYQAGIQRQAAVGILFSHLKTIEINQNSLQIITIKNIVVFTFIKKQFKSLEKFVLKIKAHLN